MDWSEGQNRNPHFILPLPKLYERSISAPRLPPFKPKLYPDLPPKFLAQIVLSTRAKKQASAQTIEIQGG